MRKRKSSWKDWFVFTKREQSGLVILCILIAVLIIFRIALHFIPPSPLSPSVIQTLQHMNTNVVDSLQRAPQALYASAELNATPKVELFHFDPNTTTDDQWLRLGLHQGQIRSLRRYMSNGRKFEFKEDLLKLYVIDSIWYNAVYPYIDLPARPSQFSDTLSAHSVKYTGVRNFKPHLKIELNTADSSDLKLIPGIGSFYARHILRYRNALGGYLREEQLAEVWKMTGSKLDLLSEYININPDLIRKLKINTITEEELRRHPYCNYTQAKAIISFRDKHGAYHSREDLEKTKIFNDPELDRLLPYVSFE